MNQRSDKGATAERNNAPIHVGVDLEVEDEEGAIFSLSKDEQLVQAIIPREYLPMLFYECFPIYRKVTFVAEPKGSYNHPAGQFTDMLFDREGTPRPCGYLALTTLKSRLEQEVARHFNLVGQTAQDIESLRSNGKVKLTDNEQIIRDADGNEASLVEIYLGKRLLLFLVLTSDLAEQGLAKLGQLIKPVDPAHTLFDLQKATSHPAASLIRVHPTLDTTEVLAQLTVEILDAVGRLQTLA